MINEIDQKRIEEVVTLLAAIEAPTRAQITRLVEAIYRAGYDTGRMDGLDYSLEKIGPENERLHD